MSNFAMTETKRAARRRGFSLIEVMVATTVLLMIIFMIGGVFREASSSWDAGYAKAEGGVIVRGAAGAVQRELSLAVDGRKFPGAWDYPDVPVSVEPTTLEFIRFTDTTAAGASSGPILVKYYISSGNFVRDESEVRQISPGNWTAQPTATGRIICPLVNSSSVNSSYEATIEFEGVYSTLAGKSDDTVPNTPDFSNQTLWNIPSVNIIVRITRNTVFGGMEVRSFGPDGIDGRVDNKSRDDIVFK